MTGFTTPRELFESALAVNPSDRAGWLAIHCLDHDQRAVVQRMLIADAAGAGSVIDRSVDGLFEDVGETGALALVVGTQIGSFQLHDQLGEGGSSIVFRASREQAGVCQNVALKLLRRNLYTQDERRRFRDERRALSQLQHPGIARLIEGGITESGTPFIALELVEGETIVEYIRNRQLDLQQRLRLFVEVCRAVEAAHRALIVHRDLKPSNVLVTAEGNIKLLDFGIAKLLDSDEVDFTQSQHLPMTPAYAAPEQFNRQPITTATDVYSLGILLGELITGQRHEQGDSRTPSAQVTENSANEARLASARVMRRKLRGDLDNIVLKATATEPERRYASAGVFADDVERHLGGQLVDAHPPSTLYRTRKFVARHRGGVALTLVFVIGLLASLALTVWQAREARQQAARANTVRDFLVSVFESAHARLPRDQRPTPETLVEQAQRRLKAQDTIDPVVRIDLQRTLAEVWLSLSKFSEAEAALSDADATAMSLGRDDLRAGLIIPRADGWQRAGNSAKALQAINPILATLRQNNDAQFLRALGVLADAKFAIEGPDAAIALYREAVKATEIRDGASSVEALAAKLTLGEALTTAQLSPDAIKQLEPALAAWRQTQGPEDDRYVRGLSSLASARFEVGDVADAERHMREVLALQQRIYPVGHDEIAGTMRNIADLLVHRDQRADAETMYNQALAMQSKVFGPTHAELAYTHDSLGVLLAEESRYNEAEVQHRTALDICAKLRLRDEVCPRTRNNLGQMYYRMDRLVDAEREMSTALAERRDLVGPDHPTIAYSLSTLANVAAKAGRSDDAVRLSRQAVELLERIGLSASRETLLVRNGLAQALRMAGHNEEALVEIDRSISGWNAVAPEGKLRALMMLVEKATIEHNLGNEDDVRATLAEISLLHVPDGDIRPKTLAALQALSSDR